MTQPQVQQLPQKMLEYQKQFMRFSALLDQIHLEYIGQAWSIAKRDGLEDAIAFCETKIKDSSLMQAYRDSENANNNQ